LALVRLGLLMLNVPLPRYSALYVLSSANRISSKVMSLFYRTPNATLLRSVPPGVAPRTCPLVAPVGTVAGRRDDGEPKSLCR
jgi:hypothetical protein